MTIIEEQPVAQTKRAEQLIEGIYALILGVTIVGWTVVGFGTWVPLLVRTTSLMAAAVFYATLFRDQARIASVERSLHFAVRFYLRGFEHFIKFYRHRHDPETPIGLLEPLSNMKWKELIVECSWVIGVWVAIYFALHTIIRGVVSVFG